MKTTRRHKKRTRKLYMSLHDAHLRHIYRTIGKQGHGDDVNPFSPNSRFPYAELQKTGKNIPRILALMRSDPEIIHQQKLQQAMQTKYFKIFSRKIRAALDKREKDEEKIRAHRTAMAKQIVLPPFPDIIPLNI
jgi:hypothetical protein